MVGKQIDCLEFIQAQQSRTQAIVDIVVVVGDLVGQVGQLRLQRWLAVLEEAPPELSQRARVGGRRAWTFGGETEFSGA